MSEFRVCDALSGVVVVFRCPGCGSEHRATIDHPNVFGAKWSWNGRLDRPTLSPSYVERVGPWPEGTQRAGQVDVCHSVIRDGMIQFLDDCTHGLRGKTVSIHDAQKKEGGGA